MLIKDIVKRVNRLLSNNSSFHLDYMKLKFYIEGAFDHVNLELKTEYPTPSIIYDNNLKYNYAVCSGYTVIYVRENDEDYIVRYSGKNLVLFNRDTDKPYSGIANAVYVEDVDKLYVKDKATHLGMFDKEISEQEVLSKPHLIENMDYTEIPDRYIRSCIVYYTAALYLEEEDELEGQYRAYKDKADKELIEWKHEYYSCYDTNW